MLHPRPLFRSALAAGAALAGLVHPALAADCLGLGPAGTPATLQVVREGIGRVLLLRNGSDREGCPADTDACRTGASLGPGYRVVVGETSGAFSCASRADARRGEVFGWVPTAALAPLPATTPTRAADWVGRWHSGPEQLLRVTSTLEGELVVEGQVTIGGEAARARRGTVRTGTLSARFRPEGAEVGFVTGDDGETLPDLPGEGERCRVTMRRVGPYLIVQDNRACGGPDVTFTGAYRRGG